MEFFHTIDGIEIEEPVGFPSLELSLTRDKEKHGIGQQASTSTLGFYGEAADYLRGLYEADGIKASAIYEVTQRCEGETEFTDPIRGRLNFGQYNFNCGLECIVALPWEHDSCELILRSRYDTKVDVDKLTGLDNLTALAVYDRVNFPMTIPAKEIRAEVEGYSRDDNDWTFELLNLFGGGVEGFSVAFRPTYADERFNSINTGQLLPVNNYAQLDDDGVLTPQLLMEENTTADCFGNDFSYTVRLKGRVKIDSNAQGLTLTAFVVLWDGTGSWIQGDGRTVLDFIQPFAGDYTANDWIEFDESFTGTFPPLAEGESFFAFMSMGAIDIDDETGDVSFEFDDETYIDIVANKACPPTDANVSMIHELFSRVSEAVTNGCVRVKSSYYGRTDSEPFSFDSDGCGGLRALTSGLKLRVAPDEKHFLSLKDLFEGVNAIDNVGWDVVEDPTLPNKFIMRVEAVDFFYLDEELATHDHIPEVLAAADESRHYAKVQIGYQKWEVERVNGLDEPNSNREYYTAFDTIQNAINLMSRLVAGSYAIEITRQQQFAATGGADTTYDNETFILCCVRTAYSFIPEQGNVVNTANLYSPGTIMNYAITPVRNLMRWFKSLAAGYVSLGDTRNKLFFSSGTGNITAEGQLNSIYTACVMEGGVVRENQDVYSSQFTNVDDYTPLWKPEIITYQYPLSNAEYLRLKENPYGFIRYQCGDGTTYKGYILDVSYSIADGLGRFTLLKAYTQ